jgi:hypothetical protein
MNMFQSIPNQQTPVVNRLGSANSSVAGTNNVGHIKQQLVSYAGSDILCILFIPSSKTQTQTDPGFVEIQNKLQTITISSARSVMPVRRIGETSPADYTRGSRTIAGSMVFTTTLRDAFVSALSKSLKDGEPSTEPTIFVDQIPKFGMAFQASNELGGVSSALLVNITLTNFGTTFSIDDIYTESTFTYVAEQYFPMSSLNDISDIRKQIVKATSIATPVSDLQSQIARITGWGDPRESTADAIKRVTGW